MKEYIPAGAGEKMQYIVHPFNDNTIRFILRYPCLLQPEAMKQAIFAMVKQVDVLHASFEADRTHARWHINGLCAEQRFKYMQTPEEPMTAAFTQALTPVEASDPVQLRCILVHGKTDSAVVLLISHLCVDGSDGKYLLRKLCEAYSLFLRTGSCDMLEIKNGSRAVEQVYSSLSKQDRRKLVKDPRTGVKCVFPFPTEDEGQPSVLCRSIPAETMAAAREKAKSMGATANDLLLTACYYAYAETADLAPGTPVSIMSMMDLRRHCKGGDSQGLTNLTGPLTTALPSGLAGSFVETLALISGQTRRSKEDPYAGLYGMPLLHRAARTLPMGLLLSAASRVYGSMSVGMTNVGNIDCQTLLLGDVIPVEGWFGGPVKRKPGVQISVASFNGACSLSIWGYAAKEDMDMLQRLLNRIAEYIGAFAAAVK